MAEAMTAVSELHPARRAWYWSDCRDMPQRALLCAAFRAAIGAGHDVTTAWSHVCAEYFSIMHVLGRCCSHGKCLEPAIGRWGETHWACGRHLYGDIAIRTSWR